MTGPAAPDDLNEGPPMRRAIRCLVLATSLAAVVPDQAALGGHFSRRRQGTPPPGEPRSIEHSHRRAGYPLCLSPRADLTNTPEYEGYYVGGGSPYHGEGRCRTEGTWGWDYVGWHLPRRVALGWNHGRREQGGTGAYETDGPHVPDVIAGTTAALEEHHP